MFLPMKKTGTKEENGVQSSRTMSSSYSYVLVSTNFTPVDRVTRGR